MTSIKADGRAEFRFFRANASNVQIAGSFNNWNLSSTPMRSAGDGWWTAELEIEAGEHHFRYIADGNWFTDFAANGVEKKKHGWNSILIVPELQMSDSLKMPPARSDEYRTADAVAA